MLIAGFDLSTLGDQFGGYVPGQRLILDADGPCYEVAATSKTLRGALSKFQSKMLEQLFITKCESASLHLTSNRSTKAGRFNVLATKPYQGNRTGQAKPPLLEAVRQAVALPENWLKEYEVYMHHDIEADDAMITEAYQLKEHGVIWSADKDLRMTPWNYWEIGKAQMVSGYGFGSLHLSCTVSGVKKCLGYGLKFFWAQMLMGDTADHIQGVRRLRGKLCGPAGAYDELHPLQTEEECANAVIDAYRAIGQNPIPEGWLLWLLRRKGDTFWQYLQEVTLSDANRAYINQQVALEWFIKPTASQPEEDEDVPY